AVTDEFVEAWRALWMQEQPSFGGKYVQFKDVVFMPKPIQKPHPPIWVGGESGPAWRRTARFGAAWFPVSDNVHHRLDTPERVKAGIGGLHSEAEKGGRDSASIETALLWFSRVGSAEQPGSDGQRRLFTGTASHMVEDAQS